MDYFFFLQKFRNNTNAQHAQIPKSEECFPKQKQNTTVIVTKDPHQIEQIPSTRTEPQKIYNHINKQSDMFGSALIQSKCVQKSI